MKLNSILFYNIFKNHIYKLINYNNLLKKSSKPQRVPTISFSFFNKIQIFEPMHLSSNSLKLISYLYFNLLPKGKIVVICFVPFKN